MIIFGLTTENYKQHGKLDFLINNNLYSVLPEDVYRLRELAGISDAKRLCVIHDGMRLRMWERLISNNTDVFYSQHCSLTSLFLNEESECIPTLRQCFEEAEIKPEYQRTDPRFLRDISKLFYYYLSTFTTL